MKRIGMMALFMFSVTGVASQPDSSQGPSVRPQPTAPAVPGAVFAKAAQEKKSKMVGFGIGPEFDDDAPEGGLLVGFNFGLTYGVNSNGEIIAQIQPVYRVGDKDKPGKIHGSEARRAVKEVAKAGYAVAGIHAKGALVVDGLYITYMKVGDNNQLDPNDAYNSKWIGGPGGNGPTRIGGTGRQVVGLHGRLSNHDSKSLVAIGLTFGPPLAQLIPVDDSKKPEEPRIPKFPQFIGGWSDAEFADNAPANGLLVGMDFAYGGLGGKNIVTVAPIYQVKGKTKDVFGKIHGEVKKGSRDRAKPGYAVGAMKVQGRLWVEGFSLVYMKIDDDKLDPSDSYESDWFGNGDSASAPLLSGEGTPAVGVLGRKRTAISALGLVFKSDKPEAKDKKKP